MKPEQLLESIGGVGEDLLAASENPIRVEKHRPRAWVALAAVLALAVGIGGFAAWKSLGSGGLQKKSSAAALPTLNTQEHTVDGPADPVEAIALPPFSVGWRELSGTQDAIRYCTEEELQAYLDFVSPGLDAAEAGSLPVYRDLSCQEDAMLPAGIHVYYSQALMTELLQEAAQAMGLTILSQKPVFFYVADFYRNTAEPMEFGPEEPVYLAQVDTDQGSLSIRGDGQLGLMYNTDYIYAQPDVGPGVSFSSADPTGISGFIAERLSFLPEDTALGSLCSVLESPISSNFSYLWTFPLRKDPVRNFLSQQLNQIRLITSFDGSKIYGFTIQTPFFLKGFQSDALVTVPECWSLIGTYPVISPEEAKNRIAQGQFLLPNRVKDLEIDTDALSRGEVVYLTDQTLAIQLPYYRFWVRTGTGTDGSSWFTPVYVPAVAAEYLSDYPGGSSMETSREIKAASIAQTVSSELSILGLKDEFYDLLANGMDRLYETWSGDDAQSHPRFGFEQTASTADGEWYWRDPSGSCTPEEAARELVTMLMKSLARESSVKDMGYELLDYHVYLDALCSSADLSVLPENVWIFDPDVTVKYTGRYGLNGTPEFAGEHGLLAYDGYYSELQQGSDYCFLYVLTYREGVWRLQRLEELVNTYLPVEHYSGHPVRDENDETLRALRIFFQDREHQALLLGEDDRLDMEIDSYLRISDDELQLRYWRGGDKMIPYIANLRHLEDGGWEVLSNDPAVWNGDD